MEANMESIKSAQEKFAELIQSEFERIERMKADKEVTDFSKLDKIVIGVLPGDGIGPIIMKEALKVLNNLLAAGDCQRSRRDPCDRGHDHREPRGKITESAGRCI